MTAVIIGTREIMALWGKTGESGLPAVIGERGKMIRKLEESRRITACYDSRKRALNRRLYGTVPLDYTAWRMRRRAVTGEPESYSVFRNSMRPYDPLRTLRWGFADVCSRGQAPLVRKTAPPVPREAKNGPAVIKPGTDEPYSKDRRNGRRS